jgi:hypothetical protein
MHIAGRRIRLGLALLAGLPALSGCGGIAHLDCEDIAGRARQLSQDRALRIESVANLRETARGANDVRCVGDVTFADGGTAPLYFRAHEENGNVEVAYQGAPFP